MKTLDFDKYLETLKETSFDKDNQVYMVDLPYKVINFDKFQEDFFRQYHKPVCRSLDALFHHNHEWYFVEFKNGKINKNEKNSISDKIGHSLLSFQDTIDEKIDYCRQNVNFILVYNPEKNSFHTDQKQLPKDEYQFSSERQKLICHLPGIKKKIPYFQMNRYEDIYFKNVFTMSNEEFVEFMKDIML